MQKDSAQAKISLKVVGGSTFFDSPCTSFYLLTIAAGGDINSQQQKTSKESKIKTTEQLALKELIPSCWEALVTVLSLVDVVCDTSSVCIRPDHFHSRLLAVELATGKPSIPKPRAAWRRHTSHHHTMLLIPAEKYSDQFNNNINLFTKIGRQHTNYN